MRNALAYYIFLLITIVKSFIVNVQDVSKMKEIVKDFEKKFELRFKKFLTKFLRTSYIHCLDNSSLAYRGHINNT